MASVVSNRRGGWEVRESHSTPAGPRSRTLATFRVLDGGVLDHAAARAERPFARDEVVRSAYRAGAEVSPDKAEAAARTLITELAQGASLAPGLSAVLAAQLAEAELPKLSPETMAAAEWAGASTADRGRALFDLLLLADAVPQRKPAATSKFPRLSAA